MKAQNITTFGDHTVFKQVDIPKPTIEPNRVIVKVHATSVNPIDCKIRAGLVPAIAPSFPAVLHGDVAGVVVEVGKGVTKFNVGDEVYGCVGGVKDSAGALAEYILVDADLIAQKPQKLSMMQAAALPLVSITAWVALFDKVRLQPNQKVLIHGGVGGVGHVAIQLAKWCGAKVYATVRQDSDCQQAELLGADKAINVRKEEIAEYVNRLTDGQGFEVILDTIGGANIDRSLQAAAVNGSVVTIAARSTHDLIPMHSKSLSLHAVFMLLPLLNGEGRQAHGEILQKVAEIIDAGCLMPLIDQRTFTLDTVGDAHAFLTSGKAKGKVVVAI